MNRKTGRTIPNYKQGWATYGESAAPEIWKSVIGAWAPFLGATGNILRGHSNNKNNGIINGATWVPGPDGWVLNFDGSAYVDISGIVDQLTMPVGTIALWINPTDFASERNMWSVGYTGDNMHWIRAAVTTSGKLSFRMRNGQGGGDRSFILTTDNPVFVAGKWTLVWLTHNGIEPMIFINNGITAPPQTFILSIAKTDWWDDLGANKDRAAIGTLLRAIATSGFSGLISDTTIWGRVLSAAERFSFYLNPYARYERFIDPAVFTGVPSVGAIMNQLQGPNLGADLYGGALM